jgi:hypothetical protein
MLWTNPVNLLSLGIHNERDDRMSNKPFTIEVYSPTSRKYKAVRSARSRSAALTALSLVKGKARVKDAGLVIAIRTEDEKGKSTLALVLDKTSSVSRQHHVDTGTYLGVQNTK